MFLYIFKIGLCLHLLLLFEFQRYKNLKNNFFVKIQFLYRLANKIIKTLRFAFVLILLVRRHNQTSQKYFISFILLAVWY
jgi:hypothetical protein